MWLKKGVKINGIKSYALHILAVADILYTQHGLKCIVTSVLDGKHRVNSKHYSGEAVDLRLPTHPYYKLRRAPALIIRKQLLTSLKVILGPDYDVIDEKDHYHVEYDPK